jgi:hypothetical protein
MMNKIIVSLNGIKKFFKLNTSPKEVTRRPQVNNLEESKSRKQGVLRRSWCANPESCLTDCQDYCKKLNT